MSTADLNADLIAPVPWRRELWGMILAVLIGTAVLSSIQYSFEGLYDGDSYFHTRAAERLVAEGIRREFPATQFSTWRDRYCDKDLLFHLLLAPLMRDSNDLVRCGKLAAVCFDALLLLALGSALMLLRARWAGAWVLILLSTHVSLLRHLMAVRPHLLGLALLAVEIAAIAGGGWKLLFLLCALHVVAHSSFVLVPVLVALAVCVRLVRRQSPGLSQVVACVAGIAVCSLLHPQFPNNLSLVFDQTLEVARNVWGGGRIPRDLFGSELGAMSTAVFLSAFPGFAPAALGLIGALTVRRPLSSASLKCLWIAALFAVLTFLSARFFSFFVVAAILLAARCWTDLCEPRGVLARLRESSGARVSVFLLAAGTIAGFVRARPGLVHEAIEDKPRSSCYQGAVEFLSRHAATEDIVYHNFWWDFSALYHFRPEGRYVKALDPIFLYRFDPLKFEAMLSAWRGQTTDVYRVVASEFDARWIFLPYRRAADARNPTAPFRSLVLREARFKQRYSDEFAEIYEVLR